MTAPGSSAATATRSAVLSDDGVYRYSLVREFPPLDPSVDKGRVCWDLCNPSTADALADDPTVRKGIGFALRWGYSSIEFVNRAAFRATNPKALLAATDPIGPDNTAHVAAAFARADLVVFAWGKAWPAKLDWLSPVPWYPDARCLGRNANDSPRHPLMLPYSTPLEPWHVHQWSEWSYEVSPTGRRICRSCGVIDHD